jgi:hypothetical protein
MSAYRPYDGSVFFSKDAAPSQRNAFQALAFQVTLRSLEVAIQPEPFTVKGLRDNRRCGQKITRAGSDGQMHLELPLKSEVYEISSTPNAFPPEHCKNTSLV